MYICVCTFVTSGLIKTLFVGFKYICRYNYIYIYIHKDPVLCISIYIHIHASIFICICMRVYFITLQLYSIIISHDGAYAKRMAGVKGQNSSSASEYTPHQCLHKHTHIHTYTRTKDPRGISSVYFVVLVTKYTKTSSSRREGERTQCILHNQPCSHSVSLRNQGQNEKLNWEKGKHKRTLIYSQCSQPFNLTGDNFREKERERGRASQRDIKETRKLLYHQYNDTQNYNFKYI